MHSSDVGDVGHAAEVPFVETAVVEVEPGEEEEEEGRELGTPSTAMEGVGGCER